MNAIVLLLAALPVLYWAQPVETAPDLRKAGIERVFVPDEAVDAWRGAGFDATGTPPALRSGRAVLSALGVAGRGEVASASLRPWIHANGWRFLRRPGGRYWYEVRAGRAPLAAAEAFAYGVDALLQVEPADLEALGRALAFLSALPAADLPLVADVVVVDDGSAASGEVLNLLARRNVLYRVVRKGETLPPAALVVRPGTREFPDADARDPEAYALKVRRTLGDDNRSLRLYGTEVVLARLTGDSARRRLHLLNYSGREMEGVRVRLLGRWAKPDVRVLGEPSASAEDYRLDAQATEFSLGVMGPYAVVDLVAAP